MDFDIGSSSSPISSFISEFESDYLLSMLRKEKYRRSFEGDVPLRENKALRTSLVNSMKRASKQLRLNNSILHNAVWLFDCLPAEKYMHLERAKAWTMASLFIAAKFILDRKSLLPYSDFCLIGRVEKVVHDELIRAEYTILANSNWNTMMPNVADFVDFYQTLPLTYDQINNMEVDRRLKLKIDSCLESFLWQILEDFELFSMPPSLTALASLSAAREMHGLNTLPDEYVRLSPYTKAEIVDVSILIINAEWE